MPPGGCRVDFLVEWLDGYSAEECPAVSLHELADLAHAWIWYEKGMLPVAGGWADQSPVFIEIIDIWRMESVKWRTSAT